jgi:hypothetical protein
VLGEIDGNITANGLIIGQEGRVKGSVTAHTVEVKGKFDGKVANSCESFNPEQRRLESGAQIEGAGQGRGQAGPRTGSAWPSLKIITSPTARLAPVSAPAPRRDHAPLTAA